MNEPARPANEHAHLRAIASGKDVSSAMDSKENVLASKKVGDYEAEDEPTHSANEQDGKNTSRVDQSSWSRFQFKQKQATVVETQSTEQQQHSEPGQRTSFGGPSPTVARVSPTVIAKAASQEADSQTLGSNGADLASQASANRNGCSQRFNESGQVGTAGISKTASLKENLDAAKAVLNMAVNLTAQEVKEPTDVTEPNSARRSFPIKHEQAKVGAIDRASESHGHGAGKTSNTETMMSDATEGSVTLTPGKDAAEKDVSTLAFQKPETVGKKKKRAALRESKNKSDWSLLLPRKNEAATVDQDTVDNPENSQNDVAKSVKTLPVAVELTNPDSMLLTRLTARNTSLLRDKNDINSPPIKRRAKGHDPAARESGQTVIGVDGNTKKTGSGVTENNSVPKAADVEVTSTGPNNDNKTTKFPGRCQNCFRKGHKSDACPRPRNDAGQETQTKASLSRSTSNASSNDKRTNANLCWSCHKPGHVRRNCQEHLSDEGSGSDGEAAKPRSKEEVAGDEQLLQEAGDKEIEQPANTANAGKYTAFNREAKTVDTAAPHEHVNTKRQVEGEHADVRRNSLRTGKALCDSFRPTRGSTLTNGMGRSYARIIAQQQQQRAEAESGNSTRVRETLKELFRQSAQAQSVHQDETRGGNDADATDEPDERPLGDGTVTSSARSPRTANSMDDEWSKLVAQPMRYTVLGASLEPLNTWSSAVFDRRLRKNIVVRLSCSEPDSLQSLFAPLVRRGHDVRCSVGHMPYPEAFLPPVVDQLLLRLAQWPADTDDGEKVMPIALVLCERPERCQETHRVAKTLLRETGLKARYSHSGNRLGGRDKKMYRGCHLLSCNISRFMALVDIGVISLKNLRMLVLDEVHLMSRDEDFFEAYLMGLLQSQELPSVNERLTLCVSQKNAGERVERAARMALKPNHAVIQDQ
ncbi:DEAD box protein/DEAH protein box helicase [Aphelenchoides avenae]|nr:DEAD box protein/DEAH protein box helicase [Aphelenchus avenae]